MKLRYWPWRRGAAPFLIGILTLHIACLADAPAPPAKVLVLPFAALDATNNHEWIGKAFQQAVVTELSRDAGVQPVAAAEPTTRPATAAEALDAARASGAQYVILGSFQVMNSDLRVLGQILETKEGRVIGGLRATRSIDYLFDIEDALASQARRQLPMATPAQPTETAATIPQPANDDGPVRIAPNDPGIAPLPDQSLPDQLALLNGPPDFQDFGYGGLCAYSGCGAVGGYGLGYGRSFSFHSRFGHFSFRGGGRGHSFGAIRSGR